MKMETAVESQNRTRVLENKSYVSEAEKAIRLLKEKSEIEKTEYKKIDFRKRYYNFKLTTTQIRKLLSILNEVYSFAVSTSAKLEDKTDNLTDSDLILKDKMQYFKMRCIYEAGRDEYQDINKTTGVHDFIYRTKILKYLDDFNNINSHKELRKQFIWIFHYMESLVAYHRFLGGKDTSR